MTDGKEKASFTNAVKWCNWLDDHDGQKPQQVKGRNNLRHPQTALNRWGDHFYEACFSTKKGRRGKAWPKVVRYLKEHDPDFKKRMEKEVGSYRMNLPTL